MQRPLVLFILACALVASLSFGDFCAASRGAALSVTFDGAFLRAPGVPASVADRVAVALRGGPDCIVAHARSWTLHVFCAGNSSDEDVAQRLRRAEPSLIVEPLAHRGRFDAHTAKALDVPPSDGGIGDCLRCCLVVRALVGAAQSADALRDYLARVGPAPAAAAWSLHMESNRVAFASACNFHDEGASIREIVAALHSAGGGAEGVNMISVALVHPSTPSNWYSRGVLSDGNPGSDFFRAVGVLGHGTVIGCADTGIDADHCFFDDPAVPLVYDAPMATHRKIARYARLVSATDPESGRDEVPGHGTHVAGTLVGMPLPGAPQLTAAVARHHGIAPQARVSFIDIGGGSGISTPAQISQLFDPARGDGATVHSNSWGSRGGAAQYTDQARQIDMYADAFPAFLPVFASGNDADTGCVDGNTKQLKEGDVVCDHYSAVAPGTCKNALCVGSSVAPLASWQEADYGNFVLEVRAVSDAQQHGSEQLPLDRGGAGVLATFDAVHGQFGASHPRLDAGKLVFVDPADACSDLRNADKLVGAVAVVTRGTCIFTEKAERLQRAGVELMVVVNTEVGPAIQMGAAGAHTTIPLTIAAVMISQESGAKLRQLESLYSAARLRVSLHETSRPLATKNRHDLSAFSGRGPTRDLRYKPDIVAPGEFVHSAASDGDPASHNCNLWASMGTSMATPQIAASAALVREYLTRNLHRAPDNSSSGTGGTGSPTAAGIKAVIILAAVPLTGVVDRNLHGDVRQLSDALSPSFEQGHGILRLASVLPNYAAAPPSSDADNENPRYSAAARQNGVTLLDVDDASTTVGQGDVRSFCFEYVNASTLPFRAVLSWTDPAALLPPSDADAQRDSLLIDDLDLIVDDAAGRRYRGNMHGADPPEVGDDRNNVEKVHAAAASSVNPRFFLVSVHGKRIASGTARRFALAVSSGHARPLSSCKLIQSLSVHRGSNAVATAIGCASDAECGADHGRGTCAGGKICLCERGYRGSRCQIVPQVLPHEGVRDGRVYPMQVQEYAFLLTRSAAPPSASSGDAPASLRVSLRSMQRDGDPNVYARFDAPLTAFSPIAAVRRTVAAVLDECDDCTPAAAADAPRDVRIARIGSAALAPQSEDGRDRSTLFLTVSAGCCWWARYELAVDPSVAAMRTVPALITAARVHRTAASSSNGNGGGGAAVPSALDAHFFEFLVEVRGEQPVSGRLRSRDAVGEDALVPALSVIEQHASWCNGALRECVLQFPVAAVQALLCDMPDADGERTPTAPSIRRTMLSLELTYSLNRTVRTDLVPGASAALNCSLLQALPLVTLPPHSAAANTGAPAAQQTTPSPPSGDTKTMHMALLVSKIADHCERALLGDYGDSAAASSAAAARTTSDDWSVAEGPVLRPAPSCFFSKEGSDVELTTTQWLILPSSIADFPVRIAVRVNLALLNATRRIASTDFLRIAFRSRATAAVHPCSRVEISDEEKEQVLLKQQEEQQAEIVVCDIGGGGAEHFIRPQTPLFLQITDMYAPNGDLGTILLDDVGVVVAAPPQAAGFATSFAPNSPAVETDFVLPHSATHVQLVALGSYFSPAVWDDAFGVAENGPEALPAGASAQTVAPAPQIEFALRSLAQLFLAPADDTEQYSLGNFAFVRCEGRSSSSGRSANVTRDRLSCAVPRGPVQCGVPLTLHLNVDRVLYGSSTELIPNSVMFPAIECGLAILGIDGPGRAVHGIRLPPPPAGSGATKAVDIVFNIVGQFGTVRDAGVSLEFVEDGGGRNLLRFGAAAAVVNVTAVPPPECRVRSTAVKMLNVACSITAEHRRVAMAGDTRPVMYSVAVHGTDLAGTNLEFTFWKTEQGEQQDLMLMLLPSRFAASVLDDAAPPTVVAVANGGAAAILRLPLRAAAGFLPPAAAAQAVVGAVSGRPLFLHVRLGEHHPCEVLNSTAQLLQLANSGDGGDSLFCIAPTVALTFSAAAAGRSGANAEGTSATLRLELWVAGQDLPVFDRLADQQLASGAFDFLLQQQQLSPAAAPNTTLIRFAARPASALLAALSQHHARRFEIAAAVFYPPASGRAPAYFEVDDAAAGDLRLSLFAVNGAAARYNPCRGATASPMLRETLSDMHAVRLSRRQRRSFSSRGGGDDAAAVVYPARFDGVTYPCGREPSAWSFAGTVLDQEEAWMQRRAFFVAVCATLGTAHFGGGGGGGAFVANVPPVQVAEFRPPRFVALHASSSVRVRTTSSSAFASEDDGDGYEREDRATSHMRQGVVQLTLPGCDNTTRTRSSSSSGGGSNAQPRQQPQLEQERLYIDRGVSLIVGVTVNVALYDSEVREMRRAEMNASDDGTGVLAPLVAVDRIFFSLDPTCASPPLTSTRIVADASASSTASSASSSSSSSSSTAATIKKQKVAVATLSARMNPLLTTLHVHDEHWWSRTTASYTFTASDALHTRDFETAAFPARAVFVCAAWSGRTDALVFQHQAGRDGASSATASAARTTSHTARIAVAQLGACTRDSDCDGGDSVCVHRLCQCSADRRGAWCEKQCPVVVVPASSGSGSAGGAVVCSGHGTCNAVAVCECSAHYTGATCSAELRAAGEQTLSRAEAASGQARGKLAARMLLTRGDLLRASTGSRLHLALDGLPTGRQLRVVLFAPALFKSGGSDAALFQQRRTLPDGRAVVLKRTPIVTFWTAAAAGGGPVVVLADSSTAVGGGGTGSSNGDEDYIARSPTFAAQGVLAPAPFRALTVEIPPLADLFDKNSAVVATSAATSSPSTAAPAASASEQIVIDVSVFMDADAPSEGGCESWICAVIAICAGIVGAAVGFGGVFMCTRWWSERKQRRLAEQQRNHAAAAASGTTATVVPPSVSD